MHANNPNLKHQFSTLEQQHHSYVAGMWVFLATEILLFGGIMVSYTVYRFQYYEAFTAGSHDISLPLGTVMTAILLTSSLFMALSVRASQLNQPKLCALLLAITIILGLIFLGMKAFEYYDEFHKHHFPGRHFAFHGVHLTHVALFFSFYFVMTGLHAIHMMIGIFLLALMAVLSLRGHFNSERYEPVEMAGLYWHFVDIVWIFLFPLLYLVGTAQ